MCYVPDSPKIKARRDIIKVKTRRAMGTVHVGTYANVAILIENWLIMNWFHQHGETEAIRKLFVISIGFCIVCYIFGIMSN